MSTTTILNVDDYEPARYARTRLLRANGFSVSEASTGSEALQLVASQDPALVILDVNLPDIDGFEVCRRLKQSAETALLPVLHVSATFTDTAHRVLALDTGADGYLIEPVEPPVLLATVNALLRMRRAEAAVRSSAREWQATFDAISDGVCVLDDEGAIVRFNGAFARLFPDVDALLGRHVTTLWGVAPDQPPTLPFVRMRQTRLPATGELLRSGRWYRVTASPVRDPSNAVRAVYIVSDITEWKQLEEERARLLTREQTARAEAEAASRAKDDFLAMLSHELRSPLAPIRLAMHSLGGQADHDPALARARDVVQRQVKHLARLVDDLLDVARLTRQQVELQREIVSVEQIVTDALEATRPLIEERAHRLSVSLPEESIRLDGDPTRLVQVIANLLTNAAKYTPAGGNIWLTASLEGEEVTLGVRDSGIGMPADLLPHVFEMFTQGDRTPARPEGGLGLGLTIARSIVARHGGRLTAHSEGRGRGSEFILRLPITHAARGLDASRSSGPAEAPVSRHVLVVEDNEDTLEMLRVTLELEGHRVEGARTGKEGVEVALDKGVDVVVTDVGLPDIDGYEVARRIRAARGSDVYLVALTGYGQADDLGSSREAGFDVHLTKPVGTEELTRVLRLLPRQG